ncbi:HCR020Cp [Eremothecium sinecaudum]|uniref:HCR020Cp n=1 Tax=Eremothecium sinecaudum TaxID=45286 RepID=A0A0X8HRL9_9SACH|nr:HCR020Cp [Eremothecium sinecaudum]AMD20170.1 HCR020Cp [Eremothecium sinecaudum]
MSENNANEAQSLSIEEEYELWKSNVPLLYDFVSETSLTWPSLTIQWLPSNEPVDSCRQELLLGTHTTDYEENYLKIAAVDLPKELLASTVGHDELSNDNKSKISIIRKYKHDGEVIRARYMPSDSNIIATINGSGEVFIYDRSKPKAEGLIKRLSHHKENGYGLAFNPIVPGILVSASDDSTVAIWDISSSVKPKNVITAHNYVVNDAKWHELDGNILGTVSEDNRLLLHDERSLSKPIRTLETASPFNTLAFSKHNTNLFAAAGTDSQVYLYDMRNTSIQLHSMVGHQASVTSLEFSPHIDGILCSSGNDRRVVIWDLTQIGAEQAPDDADDGVPELMMMHAGHKSGVNEFSFNRQIPWLMGSVEEDNIVHVWKLSKKLTSSDIPAVKDIHSLE